jgi:hypothetical protein
MKRPPILPSTSTPIACPNGHTAAVEVTWPAAVRVEFMDGRPIGLVPGAFAQGVPARLACSVCGYETENPVQLEALAARAGAGAAALGGDHERIVMDAHA